MKTPPRQRALRYTIKPCIPHAHLFSVSLTVDATRTSQPLRFSLPAWIPGSYMIREFARNIVTISAKCKGRTVAIEKIDKQTWITPAVRGALTLHYEVYAWDLSVRAAHLDATHGFYNGSSVFLQVKGIETAPCSVRIDRPDGPAYARWRLATALRTAQGTRTHAFGEYEAANYDELIDHPVEMGSFALGAFRAGGAVHEIAVTGKVPGLDLERLARDMKKICEAQIRFFEPTSGRAPMERYVFQVMAVGDGNGGLEHRASTALICKRDDLPTLGQIEISDGYRNFLGLVSHEYFHTWNVKRIKPAAFAPQYALERECHTRLLWIFEGFTSYYDDLFLVRTGFTPLPKYLESLARTITEVERGAGRMTQSVAESSFDAWTKYYRPDENTPNAVVSYYAKGALVALCLDLMIRAQTAQSRSLDDVMRALWQKFGADFYRGKPRGLAEDEFVSIAERATGVALADAVRAFAYGTGDLPLASLLAEAGFKLETHTARAASLGIKLRPGEADAVIATAYSSEAAMEAGLSGGDVLVALNGIKVTRTNLQHVLARFAAGEAITVHAFRRDELLTCVARLRSGDASYHLSPAPT
jgi:predicted metalloprotease with PDZ domain